MVSYLDKFELNVTWFSQLLHRKWPFNYFLFLFIEIFVVCCCVFGVPGTLYLCCNVLLLHKLGPMKVREHQLGQKRSQILIRPFQLNTLMSKPLMPLGHSNLLLVIIFLYWPQLHVIKYSRQPTQHTIYIDKVMPEYQNILPSEVSRRTAKSHFK